MTTAPGSPVLHSHTVRLSYADTDPAGILYYAAWLPKMEALQSEFLFLQGMRQDALKERFGWWTVTRAVHCDYLAAAALFDVIRIELRLVAIGASSFRFGFEMHRAGDGALVARATITLVSVDPSQRPIRLPSLLRERLEAWSVGEGILMGAEA